MDKKINGFGIGCIITAVAAVIALPLRIFQFFTVLEGGTGFYSENNWSVYLLYFVIAAAILSVLILGFMKRNKLEYSLESTKRPGLACISLITACGFILDAYNSFITSIMSEDPTVNVQSSTANPAGIIFTGQAIFAVVSALYFIILSLTYFSGKTNESRIRLLALSPVIWGIIRIVTKFMRTISYIRVSELMFEMMMIAFTVMFFMLFAQVNTGIGSQKSEWKIVAYGLPAVLMALLCFVPRLVLTLTGNTELFYSESKLEFCDLGTALFIIAVILTRITDKIPEQNADAKENN